MSRRAALVVVAAVTALLAAGSAVAVSSAGRPPSPGAAASPVLTPVAVVTSSVAGGRTPWSEPLAVAARDGVLTDVQVIDPDGSPLRGALQPDGGWRSLATLIPGADYAGTVVVRDSAGDLRQLPLKVRTSDAEKVLHARVTPGDGTVVGVGLPVSVDLDQPVSDRAARAAVVRRLTVTATPAVVGGWRWMSDTQLHYRPARFWAAGTKVHVVSNLRRLHLPDGTWGSGIRTSDYAFGDALVSTVDVAAHRMTVTRNGRVLRVLRASMGSAKFPTRGGTHLVLEKNASRVMNSDTVGLPGEYRTKVDWAVRLTYSGTFTHSAPWSVASQGVRNVSHGCINLSPADAKWFYDRAHRGDVVKIVNSSVGPKLSDPGAADWNLSFGQWRAGSPVHS